MRKELEELIRILSQEESKKEALKEIFKGEMRGVLKEFLEEIALVEREAHCESQGGVGNGFYSRGLDSVFGKIEDLRIPRTREGGFKPFFVEPYRRVSWQLEELIIAMYQGGCSTRDISRTISALVDGRYNASWVSRITDVIQEKIEAYRRRPLDKWYPIIFIDGVVIKIRRQVVDGEVVYIALGIDDDGHKEVLGFWLGGSEGESSDIWKEILYELNQRGLKEPLLLIGDGLKGLSRAVKEVYPRADFQSCILHKVRHSLNKVRIRHRTAIKEDLKGIYRQKDEAGFKEAFIRFKHEWGKLYPEIIRSWEAELGYLMTYLRYPEEIRWLVYTTNPLERFIKEVKRRSKVIEVFPAPDACSKIVYLVTQEMNEKYSRRVVAEFWLAKEGLLSIRREKYGQVEATSPDLCLAGYIQSS